MMDGYRCENKETLVAYLYDEIGDDERREVETHLLTCAACSVEAEALSGVRQDLASWVPPDAALGFTIGRKPPAAVSWLPNTSSLPGWARLAAAVVVLAAGAAIANVQVRYADGDLTVTTGWMTPNAPPGTVPAALQTASATEPADWRPALANLEADMRREMQTQRVAAGLVTPPSNAAAPGDAAVLRRIQSLIDESEQRQRQELAVRLTQFTRDLEVQRRADLVRIEQGFGQFEGRTGAEVARQRQVLNYLVRVSGQVPQQ